MIFFTVASTSSSISGMSGIKYHPKRPFLGSEDAKHFRALGHFHPRACRVGKRRAADQAADAPRGVPVDVLLVAARALHSQEFAHSTTSNKRLCVESDILLSQALNSIFFFVLVPITRSCFFLQTEHSRIIFWRLPCFFTVFSPARLPPWPMSFRSCLRLPIAIGLALPLEALFALLRVCFLQLGQ